MRELRFRAWVFYGERLKKPHYSRDYDSLDGFFEDHDENDTDQCIEQYTGLKDKNGKEIYEGDIVQIDDHVLGDFKIVWHGLGWKIKRAVGYETLAVHKSQDCTVIGNTHENPDLLKKEK